MKITFDAAVTQQLLALTADSAVDFVLDFDHTLSEEVVGSSCCGITRYRIVAVDKGSVPAVFDGQLDSALGKFFCKKWGMMYFDEEMTVRTTANGLIEIMGRGELIAPHIELVDYRHKIVTAVH
ncbi:iron-sulfur cluster biosynthesis family protein [Lactococcus kimchii]|uniref:iron-sulfur cluster biosynthesis family protein n=1 Tax=Lactococcus sp. S-13 TaxID=2507158 RepID=UPI0010237C6A|nr:iron-sulfur cluster biosynthesis family protein [Lactococcus sp. S-13]RZI48527.1 iron-sulfur cluster biosynthesis family protein [Lactococcus sp. S-13]